MRPITRYMYELAKGTLTAFLRSNTHVKQKASHKSSILRHCPLYIYRFRCYCSPIICRFGSADIIVKPEIVMTILILLSFFLAPFFHEYICKKKCFMTKIWKQNALHAKMFSVFYDLHVLSINLIVLYRSTLVTL